MGSETLKVSVMLELNSSSLYLCAMDSTMDGQFLEGQLCAILDTFLANFTFVFYTYLLVFTTCTSDQYYISMAVL